MTKPFNKKHRRKPKTGPNSRVDFYDGYVRKTMNRKRNPKLALECVTRFKTEVDILKAVAETDIERVVPILKDSLSKEPYWYEMPRLDGDLEDVVEDYKGDAMGAVRTLRPIVRALQRLSEQDPAIVHRDLKPQNILYKAGEAERELWLTDFGCGHLDEADVTRPTWDFRAVGATHYRAPEYAHGRVEPVTTAGDVFSIGKLLWHMVNGVSREVFPYTLWYPPEYDLSRRFADPHVARLNLVIAHCVAVDPSKRPSYKVLIEELENLGQEHSSGEMSLKDQLARRDAHIAAELEEARAHSRTLVQVVVSDLKKALDTLQAELGELDELKPLLDAPIPSRATKELLQGVVDRGIDGVIWDAQSRSLRASALLYARRPEFGRFPFVRMIVGVDDDQGRKRATTLDASICEDSGATRKRINIGGETSEGAYDGSTMLELLSAGLKLLVPDE